MNAKKVLTGIKHYAVDTTGLLLASTPIYAAMEVFTSGMSVATSLEARLKVAQLGYLGMGIAYAKGRDFSKKIFKIDEQAPEWKQTVHDSVYNVAFNIVFATPIYLSSGADLEQTIKGVAGASTLGLVSGPINGYSIDTFRDFAGTKKSTRLPKPIQNIGSKTKKLIAAGLIAATIVTTAGVYKLKESTNKEPVKIEIQHNNLEKQIQSTYSNADF